MPDPGRTIVYIDGFNLYYGSVFGTQYKWLDVQALAENCFTPSKDKITQVKYFTAKSDDDHGGTGARNRQATYLRALRSRISSFYIQYGHHIKDKRVRGYPTDQTIVIPRRKIEITINEEKGSDVNLAVNLVSDAHRDKFDTAIVISNDGDLKSALIEAKGLGKTVIGLIPWRRGRTVSRIFINYSDNYFLIDDKILAASQLPNPVISSAGGEIYKPIEW